MPFFDMPLADLETYRPDRAEPPDFDAFWQATLNDTRQQAQAAQFTPYDGGLTQIDVYDVVFSGYGGQSVYGWYLRPAGVIDPLPLVVQFIGYGGGRGYPHAWLLWPSAGYATFVMDTRGQGSQWQRGDTPDIADGDNPSIPGFMTRGILNRRHYYYRRVYTDAVRAVETMLARDDVDAGRVALAGRSQGGGITLAAAGLLGDAVQVALPDVPFLCHFERAVGLTDKKPYQEIVDFLHTHRDKEAAVFETLAYFDGLHFAPRITARTFASVGLMDMTCPPSTIYAAYNAISAPKQMAVYRFNEHEGGGLDHDVAQIRFLNDLWGPPASS